MQGRATVHTVRTGDREYILTIYPSAKGTGIEVMERSLVIIRLGQVQDSMCVFNNGILMSTIRLKEFNCLEWLLESHRSFIKPSKLCRPPHFNKDIIGDDVYRLCKEHEGLTIEQVHSNIKKMNVYYMQGKCGFDRSSVSLTIASRCDKQGLWLFCRSRTIDRGYFSLVLKA